MVRAGLLRRQHLDIVQKFAAGLVDANGAERFALILGAGHPDLVSSNDRRGISLPRDRGFPSDVFAFLPVNGNALLSGMALPVRPPKLRPIRCQTDGEQQKSDAG